MWRCCVDNGGCGCCWGWWYFGFGRLAVRPTGWPTAGSSTVEPESRSRLEPGAAKAEPKAETAATTTLLLMLLLLALLPPLLMLLPASKREAKATARTQLALSIRRDAGNALPLLGQLALTNAYRCTHLQTHERASQRRKAGREEPTKGCTVMTAPVTETTATASAGRRFRPAL